MFVRMPQWYYDMANIEVRSTWADCIDTKDALSGWHDASRYVAVGIHATASYVSAEAKTQSDTFSWGARTQRQAAR